MQNKHIVLCLCSAWLVLSCSIVLLFLHPIMMSVQSVVGDCTIVLYCSQVDYVFYCFSVYLNSHFLLL